MYNIPFILLAQILLVVASAKVPAVIVFGDSSVDAGNNNYIPTIAKSDFPPYGRDFFAGIPTGRFCNGRLPPDFISQAFALKPAVPAYLDPNYHISDFATGVCFASAATGYDNATSDVLNVIPLWKQVEYYKEYQTRLRFYLGNKEATNLLGDALYLVSIGTNDFLENYLAIPGGRQSQFTVGQYEDFLVGIAGNFVRELYDLGARKISLGGLPPMGCLPFPRFRNFKNHHGCVKEYNALALDFNGKLEGLVAKLNKELVGIQLVFSNPYNILLDIIARPNFYGFEVADMGCCATGTFEMGFLCSKHNPLTCRDADKYVFWDAIHPSQKTNQIITDYLLQNVLPKLL